MSRCSNCTRRSMPMRATFALASVSGSERKTTGSFFTPEDLITVLLDSALDPVIAQALLRAGSST